MSSLNGVVSWRLALGAASAIFILSKVFKLLNGIKAVNGVRGLRVPFQPLAMPAVIFPSSWWNPGVYFTWSERLTFYRKWGSEVVSIVPFLSGRPTLYTSNIDVARQVVAGGIKSPWIKPESASQAMMIWGMNLIASEKETWRRHRRIMGPAFNPKTYSLVWSETLRIFKDMVSSEGWDTKDSVEIAVIQEYTFKLALYVISSVGFGLPFIWDAPPTNEDGSMPLQEAFKTFTDHPTLWLAAPKWLYKLPFKWIPDLPAAHSVLQNYMTIQINERKVALASDSSGTESQRSDVFSLLVRANNEDEKLQLDDSEVIGNVFGLLFAGHETTAHTLAATLGFLGIHPQIQKEVYEEIIQVIGHDRDPTYEDFNKLEKVLSVFYESLRLYPAGYVMIREAIEDTVLTIPSELGKPGNRSIAIQKGAQVVVDMVGVQYNPRYFTDPYKYDPSRWYGTMNDSEAASAFSFGPRTCIGRHFAAMEAVCFLTLLIKDWHVEPIMKEGETGEQWRERVMPAAMMLTLGVSPVPVRLRRRSHS
ncbi:hypothetical protein HETIRDRAFT_420783 [Heterobasidion irregulare TC 32-1]|uniref:Cytochrome P450 n=1 Tax=Heterobasidion irregulare (strain TC 32-1) TaxID=747525 RepID=W4JY05_HETIT|nr:uncharacterized protein HETIRDRAFT_420783 [Heterobasidion irregulare TC 32-1]ETW77975.1 hypothetical protein HETIRDRAFT_420783 [Heterobasidion irregulare TC 32-1]